MYFVAIKLRPRLAVRVLFSDRVFNHDQFVYL